MKNIFVAFIVVVISNVTLAGQVTQSNLEVKKVMAGYSTGEIYFLTDVMPQNPFGCTSPKSGYNILVVDPELSDISQVLSILLAAKLSAHKVEVQIYDDRCLRDHAVVRRVAIQ